MDRKKRNSAVDRVNLFAGKTKRKPRKKPGIARKLRTLNAAVNVLAACCPGGVPASVFIDVIARTWPTVSASALIDVLLTHAVKGAAS